MPKHEEIRVLGFVKEILKGGKFLCSLEDNPDHTVEASICGKMRIKRIVLCVGDLVDIELSPYDLSKGRILWRYEK